MLSESSMIDSEEGELVPMDDDFNESDISGIGAGNGGTGYA